MIQNYKNNLIRIRPSRVSYIWFELFINGNSEGDFRSVESAFEHGEFLVDSAINNLKSIDATTVIDYNYEDYLNDNLNILNSLKLLSGYDEYIEIVTMYEGISIGEFIDKFK
jgi:hypothetical protein